MIASATDGYWRPSVLERGLNTAAHEAMLVCRSPLVNVVANEMTVYCPVNLMECSQSMYSCEPPTNVVVAAGLAAVVPLKLGFSVDIAEAVEQSPKPANLCHTYASEYSVARHCFELI